MAQLERPDSGPEVNFKPQSTNVNPPENHLDPVRNDTRPLSLIGPGAYLTDPETGDIRPALLEKAEQIRCGRY